MSRNSDINHISRWREIEAQPRPATIGDLLSTAAARFGDSVLYEFFDTGRTLTFQELDAQADVVGAAFQRLGVAKGDHVAVMLLNDPEFPVVFCALARIGAVMVSINTRSTGGELDHILSDADVSAMVIDASLLDALNGSKFADAFPGKLVVTNQNNLADAPAIGASWDEFITPPGSVAAVDLATTDPVTILYTSGSTGFPKGCVHSHQYWLVLAQSGAANREPETRVLSDSPYFYMTGPSSTCGGLWTGATHCMPRRPSMSKFMPWVREHRIDSAWVTVLQLADQPHPDDRNHPMRYAFTDDIPGDRIDEFAERFGIEARNMYAMTEIGVGTIVPNDDAEMARAGSVGIPGPFRECMLIDDDLGPLLAPEATGEMCVRGLGIFDGYYNRPEANAASFLEGGWFRTGDRLHRDARGWYYFLGRIKDIVRRAGENISAVEVESALEAITGIAKAVVVPVPDPFRGEEVKAYLVLTAGTDKADIQPDVIIGQLRGRIADYKLPRYFEYRDELPRTDSDKVSKRRLVEETDDLRQNSYDRVDGVWR